LAAVGPIRPLLDERVRAGRVVEGHGDLRPEHVCLRDPVAVIDCLEFSRELRVIDCIDELGFLALECERLGAAATGSALLHRYSELSGDWPPAPLLHFYQSCRASTRALIAARHQLDEKFRHSPHWGRRAQQYLQLAEQHIGHCQ
jgi:aminoglycoside phosphotransferase family enzyme